MTVAQETAEKQLQHRLLEDLATLARRGEQWLLVGADSVPAGDASWWSLRRERLRTEGAWDGHACQPALLEHSLDGLVLLQRDDCLLQSWPEPWLGCLRGGARLVLLSTGRGGGPRRQWLRRLRRLQAQGRLRCVEGRIYRRAGPEYQAQALRLPGSWLAGWRLASSAAMRLDFVRDEGPAQALVRPRPARERVALPLQGVRGV